ncbi:MAG: hypothetical protein JKY37_17495 [Nannocystaceae bacterium]|nr:hypothetical protein [Nannocystaceae bacterium]
MASLASAPRSPSRALLHPLWLGSLVVLALNDHVLKGSEHLPGIVTGKASDFAGLLVAPLLLAVVLRLRSERGWRLSHLAVGLVFAAIQLSAPIANAWSGLMGVAGFPWEITRDATDLVALPMLLASWHWLGAAQHRAAGSNARRTSEAAAASVGLFACVATSRVTEPAPPPEQDTDGWDDSNDDFDENTAEDEDWDDDFGSLPDFTADAYLHNATDTDLVVRIRGLKPAVELDCDVIAQAPGALLTSPLFDLAETWTLPAGTNQPIGGAEESRSCRAALVEIDGLAPRLLFWEADSPEEHTVPGHGSNPSDPGELAIIPQPDGARGRAWSGADAMSYELAPEAPACESQPDAQRLAWSQPAPWGTWTVTAVRPGYDGCFEIELEADDSSPESWFVCVPEQTMTIETGDDVELEAPPAGDGFVMTVLNNEVGERGLVAVAWNKAPQLFGFELAVIPDFYCDAEVQPSCGTVASPAHVSVVSDNFSAAQLRPGDDVTTLRGDNNQEYRFALMHGQDRNAVDPECGLGPGSTGYDIEIVVGITTTPAE